MIPAAAAAAAADWWGSFLNIQRVSLVCFQVTCPLNPLTVRWKRCRWLVTHMTHLYFKEAYHQPRSARWPREQSRLDIGSHSGGHLITNLIGLCQMTAAVILHSSDFRKAFLMYTFRSWNRQLLWSAGAFYYKWHTSWGQNNGTTQKSTLSHTQWRMGFLF